MFFHKIKLSGAFIVDIDPIVDERGFFARGWCENEFKKHGLDTRILQCNLSQNKKKGTLRGLHYQASPYQEAKLIRCIKGSIFDVIIDLRSNSDTFLKWFGVELTAENYRMLYVPENFAHGYQTLEDNSVVFYQVSEFYKPEYGRGIKWNDPSINIRWPLENKTISTQDQRWPLIERNGSFL